MAQRRGRRLSDTASDRPVGPVELSLVPLASSEVVVTAIFAATGAAQPGREDALSSAFLQHAGLTLLLAAAYPPAVLRRIYAPVEPVIPYASL